MSLHIPTGNTILKQPVCCDTGKCKYDLEKRTPVVGITGYNTIPSNDLEATLQHIANVGPLAVSGDATRWQVFNYIFAMYLS